MMKSFATAGRPARRTTLLARFAALVVALTLPAAPGAATLEERLTALEQQVEKLARENETLRTALATRPSSATPTLSPAAAGTTALPAAGAPAASAVAVVPGGKESKLMLGGFVQINAESGGTPDARWNGAADRFFVRRARLALTASFAEHVTARLEGAFGAEALAPRTANTVQAMDAYVQWSRDPALVLRAGQFKSPFGYEQLTSDLKGYVIERTLPNDRLTVGRQIGFGVAGEPASRRFNYAAGVFNGNGTNTSANDNENFLTAARVGVVPFESAATGRHGPVRWSLGTNAFTTSDNGAFTGRRTAWGVDSQVVLGATEFWAEWLRQEQRPVLGSTTTQDGWSVLAAHAFSPQWQGAIRYETYDSNTALMNATTRTWTFGANYLLKGDDLKFSLNYVRGTPPGPQPAAGRWLGRVQVIF